MADATLSGLKGKRVLIAGGSSGIGAAAAIIFARSGASVCILGRSEDKCRDLLARLPGQGTYTLADLNKPADCTRAVHQAVSKLDGLDVLVNVGGGGAEDFGPSLENFLAVYNANVISAVALMDAAEEHLVAAKGAFINISSVVSEIPLPMAAGYCAAKAAQDALTKSWALKYASKGVRVNAVQPGPIDTAAIPTVAEKWGVPVDAFKASNAAATAVGRLGAPEHVGAAIAFLASDLAQYITGVILPVDGGAKLGFWANAQHKIAA